MPYHLNLLFLLQKKYFVDSLAEHPRELEGEGGGGNVLTEFHCVDGLAARAYAVGELLLGEVVGRTLDFYTVFHS